jgi:WD40 repeat protein
MLILHNENILKMIFISYSSRNAKKTFDKTNNAILCKTLLKTLSFDKIFRSMKNYFTLLSQSNSVDSLALLPNGNLISMLNGGTIKILNSTTLLYTKTITDEYPINSLTLLSDGNIATTHANGVMKIWDPQEMQCLKTIPFPENYRLDSLFLLSNKDLACTCKERTEVEGTGSLAVVHRFIVAIMCHNQNYKIVKQFEAQSNYITPMANLSNNRFAIVCRGGSIQVCDMLDDYKCLKTLIGNDDMLLSLLFIDKNNVLLSGFLDGTIMVWDVIEYHCIKTINAYQYGVKELLFLRLGYYISCSFGGEIKVWDLNGFKCINTLESIGFQNSLVLLGDYGIASILETKKIIIWIIEEK